ncbi:hypothetical protein ACFX13_030582 [Malus domestica]
MGKAPPEACMTVILSVLVEAAMENSWERHQWVFDLKINLSLVAGFMVRYGQSRSKLHNLSVKKQLEFSMWPESFPYRRWSRRWWYG